MITKRRYKILEDFTRVHNFLTETYEFGSIILPQVFEYAHMHGAFEWFKTHHFGIWEDDGKIIGATFFEMDMGYAYLHTHKDYRFLLPEILEWAERELYSEEDGKRLLEIEISENEHDKRELLKSFGYSCISTGGLWNIFPYDKLFPECKLPEGFTIIDGTNVDYLKLHHCWYLGFDHSETPNDNFDCRVFSWNNPSANSTFLTIVVAPTGEYACALGMWVDETNKYAYLEPLATIPKYRRMGLAKVCLIEAMKKTKALGAKYCIGGDREFYTDIGFETMFTDETWEKEW